MYAVIEEKFANRDTMKDSVAKIVLLTTNENEALKKAYYLANKHGLLRDSINYKWWDNEEGFMLIHIQEV